MRKPTRKRRTRQHIIADLAVNHVERRALLCGFVVERLVHDYGIDLEVFTFNPRGEIEEGKILLQVKASDRPDIRPQSATLTFRTDRRDLVSWLNQPMPVVLIVSDVGRDSAYWLYVQSYFAKLEDFNLFTAGKTVTVQIPLGNRVNRTAMRRFARFRDRVLEQMREMIHEEE